MNVALFGTLSENDTGPSRVTEGLSKGLSQLNCDVTVFAMGDEKNLGDVTVEIVGDTPSSVREFYNIQKTVRDRVGDREFDIFNPLETYMYSSDVYTVQWTFTPIEMWKNNIYNYYSLGTVAGDGVYNIMSRIGSSKADYVIASSPETERQMKSYWRFSPDQVIQLGSEKHIKPTKTTGKPTVLIIGRIDKKKGQKRVSDSLDSDQFDVRMIGGISDENYYKSLDNSLKENHLGFLSREKLEKQLKSADIVIVPSYHENFSMVGVDALSYGNILVISNTCGLAQFESVSEHSSVYTFNTENTMNKIMKSIQNLSLDERHEKKYEAYQLSLLFDWEKIAEEYREVYKEVCFNNK